MKISKNDLQTWADYLVDYSLGGIEKDDLVMIKGEHISWPLISVLQDEIFKAGGRADVNLIAPDNDRGKVWGASSAKHGTVEQIKNVPQWMEDRYNAMTKYIEVLGAEDPNLYSDLPEKTSRALMKADEPLKMIRMGKPWVLTLFPTKGFADFEGMSLEEYAEIVVSASTVDPALLDELEEDIYKVMNKSRKIRIVTECPDTKKELELTMDISNKNVVKCTGKRNFPDGEVFTSPDANTPQGEIFVDLPVFYTGTTIQGIYLKFENGKIVDYSAKEGGGALKKIIETDDGSHRLGEVALGMNSGIQVALKHPLFVEKVGGTLHIAIGASYPECFTEDPGTKEGESEIEKLRNEGVYNKSAQHVDIVTDFRPGGFGKAVYLDDVKIEVKDGIWIVPE